MANLRGVARTRWFRKIAHVGAAWMAIAQAQLSGEYELKAAFLYNFTKFVEWPEQSFKTADDPIAICILGENSFGRALEDAVAGRSLERRKLVLRQV